MTVLDWIGRYFTLIDVAKTCIRGFVTLNQMQAKQLEEAKKKYLAQGMSEKKAAIYAVDELGFLDANPEDVCRLAGIKH